MFRRLGTAFVALVLVAAAVAAQEQQATHIVRPGDTLRGLTRQHLGTELRWEENWRLNPELEDPAVLTPGQRIRILVPQNRSPVPTARLILVSGDVEERPAPVDWQGARREDLLLARDGLRTGESSASVMQFTDGTRLALTEGSLVFLRRAGRSLEGVDERSIEILEGQAELAATETDRQATTAIEIVVGNAIAKPQAGDGGELQARARKTSIGGSAVMMYEGSGEVEAAGQKVEVERGMGTAVPEAGPPAPPEKLLPAPASLRPAAGQQLPDPEPEFAWGAVPEAASYLLEVCTDAACLDAFLRQPIARGTTWRAAPPLPVGAHHWRVTAVSASGLDGYPSAPAPFTVLSDRRDREPPAVSFELEGPSVERGGRVYLAPSASVQIEVVDHPAGVESWHPVVDGRPAEPGGLAGGWGDGDHAVDVVASDRLGNEATREGPRFAVDAEPPRLIWEAGAEGARADVLSAVEDPDQWSRRLRSWHKKAERSFRRRGADPALWTLVAWSTDAFAAAGSEWSLQTMRWRERRRHQSVSFAGDSPAFLIVAPRLTVPGAEGALGARLLLVRAVDDRAGVRSLALRTVAGEDGPKLEAEAIDRLGNRRRERAIFVVGD